MTLKRSRTLAELLLIAAPPLLIGLLIFRNGVDTTFWDEWDGTAPLFEKMAAGTLGFADFFAQHNEHRILCPRLIRERLNQLVAGHAPLDAGESAINIGLEGSAIIRVRERDGPI